MAVRSSPPVARRVPYVSPAGGFAFLVRATVRVARARHAPEARNEESPPRIWARIVPPIGKGGSTMHRADWLTPYTAETIAADVLRAGRGARLDVTLAASATDAAWIAQARFRTDCSHSRTGRVSPNSFLPILRRLFKLARMSLACR